MYSLFFFIKLLKYHQRLYTKFFLPLKNERCADLLNTCQFRDFWDTYLQIPLACPEFERLEAFVKSDHSMTAIRRSILQTISFVYKSAPVLDIALSFLHFSTVDCFSQFVDTDVVASKIVEKVVNDKVEFKPNIGNMRKSNDCNEEIEYASVYKMINKMSVV